MVLKLAGSCVKLGKLIKSREMPIAPFFIFRFTSFTCLLTNFRTRFMQFYKFHKRNRNSRKLYKLISYSHACCQLYVF